MRFSDSPAAAEANTKNSLDFLMLVLLLLLAACDARIRHQPQENIISSRAFFRDAEVVILDEPTAALDPMAEAAVFEHFAQLTEGKTSIFISHRLGSCRHVDLILVMKDGCLVEQGTHEQLMEQQGEYARMFETQAKWYQ